LIEKILVVDPDERITCEQAIAHPFFTGIHDRDDEPAGAPYDDAFEELELDEHNWKSKLLFMTFFYDYSLILIYLWF
jgi:hypothetical protein